MKTYKHFLLLLFFGLLPSIVVSEKDSISISSKEYSLAYNICDYWPIHIIPSEDLYKNGARIVEKDIPTVLIRAYPDGILAINDRSGNHLISYEKTDFLKRVYQNKKSNLKTTIFLNQIVRRVFDLKINSEKTLNQEYLDKFENFMIVEIPYGQPEKTKNILTELKSLKEKLQSKNTLPILHLDTLIENETFYSFIIENEINYPVVVPIFTPGFKEFVYTERESLDHSPLLIIKKTGKLIRSLASLSDY